MSVFVTFFCGTRRNEGDLKALGSKDKPHLGKNYSDSRFSITVLRVGSEAVVNASAIFLEKDPKLHPRLRCNNLVIIYILTEGSCVIPKKSSIHG